MSGRIRTMKPEWLDDERLALASSDARVLSVALILLADDYGNGRASLPLLAGRVFPGKILETVESALAELAGWFVELYSADGQQYFHIRNWAKHQKVDKPGKPRVPAPFGTLAKVPDVPANLPESLAPDLDLDHDQERRSDEGSEPREAREPDPKATICPLGLVDKLDALGVVQEFVERYHVEADQIRDSLREFVSYWTIGGGQGRREFNWAKKAREHVRRACERPGGLKPIGELLHGQNGLTARDAARVNAVLAEVNREH